MLKTAVLLSVLCPSFQGDPPNTTVPEAATTEAGEHPVVAAVRASLEQGNGKTTRPFTLIVSIQTSTPKKLIEAFKTPLAETRKEAGNIAYLLSQDTDEKEKFVLYERWKSLDDLAKHLAEPYLVQLLQDLDAMATIELRVLRPINAGRKKVKKDE